MAATQSHKLLIKKLKKQVRLLERKEQQSRNQMKAALKKVRKLGRAYKNKLADKMRMMQSKIAAVQASTYAKVASDIERQMMKGIEAKAKSLKATIGKLEKKSISRLTKSIAKKGKKSGKAKKTAKAVKAAPIKMKKAKRSMRRGSGRSRRRS